MHTYFVFKKKYFLLGILIVLLDGLECQPTSESIQKRIAAMRSNKSKEFPFGKQTNAHDTDTDSSTTKHPPDETSIQEESRPPQGRSALGTSANKEPQKTNSKCKCGVRRNYGRVVGGDNAYKNEFPWIAALVLPGTRKSLCAGSLINNRYILTAGHCFVEPDPKSTFEILLHAHLLDRHLFGNETDPTLDKIPGWNRPNETDESEKSIRVKIMEVHVHPKFDLDSFHYDYAILKLAESVDLVDSSVAPICLPKQTLSYEDGKTKMTVAGWGVPWENGPANSRILQKLDVPYVSNKLCLKYSNITETHLCAGYLEGGKDACQGDSGGPLIYLADRDNNKYVLSGVVSAGDGCARKSQLGWYSDVKKVVQWIYSIASSGTWCAG